MKIAKNISLGIGMQVLVLLMHILIHSVMYVMDGSFDDIQIACSFVAVILITYLAVLCFDLPVYAIFCGAVISFSLFCPQKFNFVYFCSSIMLIFITFGDMIPFVNTF